MGVMAAGVYLLKAQRVADGKLRMCNNGMILKLQYSSDV
jgi:hypothetical protein